MEWGSSHGLHLRPGWRTLSGRSHSSAEALRLRWHLEGVGYHVAASAIRMVLVIHSQYVVLLRMVFVADSKYVDTYIYIYIHNIA